MFSAEEGGSQRGYRGDMDRSQDSVERKAHGARMPTDPSHPEQEQSRGEQGNGK